MTVVIVALLWAAVAVYGIRQGRVLVDRWLTLTHPAPEVLPSQVEVPDDIVARAMQESEEWAREEVIKVARMRYAELRGTGVAEAQAWNLVRKAIGVGGIDT